VADAWLILPTYNEAENIDRMVRASLDQLARSRADRHHILVVDDGSPDGTGRLADQLAAIHPEVHVLHRARREGLGPAYVAGFMHALQAGAGCVLQMDADGSHDPRDLARLLSAVRSGGADLAIGSRYAAGGAISDWSALRRVISRGGCWYARTVLGVAVRDLTGGFKCYRASVLQSIDLETVRSRGYAFQVELTYRALRAGFRVVEVPITFAERVRGRSKMTLRIALEAMWLVPQLPRGARKASLAPPRRAPAVAVPEIA
jgi:dolichol-phosphate mannosyltransferase